MRQNRTDEIKGIILFAVGILVLASLVSYTPNDLSFYTSYPNIPAKNFIRIFGAYLSWALIFMVGWASYLVPVLIFMAAAKKVKSIPLYMRLSKIIAIFVFFLAVSGLVSMIGPQDSQSQFTRSGIFGLSISSGLSNYIGPLGSFVVLLMLAMLCVVVFSESLILPIVADFLDRMRDFFITIFQKAMPKFKDRPRPPERKEATATVEFELRPQLKDKIQKLKEDEADKDRLKDIAARIKIQPLSQKQPAEKIKPKEVIIGDYRLPSLDLLESPPPLSSRHIKDDLAANARILEETLADFGISVKVLDVERGPAITRYELEPAPGLKVQKIVTLSDDIALAMKAQSVRIVAPIPGKSRVGVEVPNSQTTVVYLKEILESPEFQKATSKLTLALGKDITGNPVIADLGEMPHLLIAGTTGSGKTVCVNALITSMLYKATPNEVKFMMIDPKMVEMAQFNGSPHLLCPVITDTKKVSAALNWVVGEMEDRYQLFAKAGTRNIEGYNQKEQPLPYIVVIVDELADLMMIAQQQIETAITRLAQLSRAVGIHLILATQRPSVDVVTGVIKANFPARVSFKVASKVDSRTVLDLNGADKLLGKGDLLFLKPGESKLIRAQGCFIQDNEIERIVGFIKSEAQPVYNEEILSEKSRSFSYSNYEKDELYDEAVRVIIESNQASVSILQRRMRLGYNRAARIIDEMEKEGIVGAPDGAKPRKILVDRQEWLVKYNSPQP